MWQRACSSQSSKERRLEQPGQQHAIVPVHTHMAVLRALDACWQLPPSPLHMLNTSTTMCALHC